MARLDARIRLIEVVMLLGAIAMVTRAGYLQLAKGQQYAREAAARRTQSKVLEAPRGRIYDRHDALLATSLEQYRLDIAGEQVTDAAALLAVYRADVGGNRKGLERALRTRSDFYAHGPFTASEMRRLRTFNGVHLRPLYRREYPSGPLARPLIGSLAADGPTGATGLERFLDSLLTGQAGQAVLIKDRAGRTYESPGRVARMPVRGHDVMLTIDRELQGIAEGALTAAFAEYSPRRGDIVFIDPRTGEILAAASREVAPDGREAASASYFTSSFEPGSTAKPLTAAGLLELGRVGENDAVTGEGGEWAVNGRPRPVRDDHPVAGPITLGRAIEVSSNIAMAKFSQRLAPAEHYDVLRSFGISTPTGVEFSVEDPGRLPPPHRWHAGLEGVSAAMGYNVQVTPIQLAAAYGALANDGLLMSTSLIKEIRAPDGRVIYRHTPVVVRRVVSAEVAATVRGYLARSAGELGTGGRSQVKGTVLGKTGTARLVENGRYINAHAASFAGIYPADDPQLVVVVRIERPEGNYYGGFVAAPLVRRMLSQALAARRTALDRVRLAGDRVERPARSSRTDAEDLPRTRSWVAFPLADAAAAAATTSVVPDVTGQSVRKAAEALYQRGFQVQLDGAGFVRRTVPAAGDSLTLGKVVTVVATMTSRP